MNRVMELLTHDEKISHRQNTGDYYDQYSLDRYSSIPQPLLERRQKDMGPDNPHYYWDWVDPRLYE